MQQQDINLKTAENRIAKLKGILNDERHQIILKVKRSCEDLLNNKKYRDYRQTLEERVQMTTKFIIEISNTFFTMLSDIQFLSITTQIDIMEKIQKYKKNITSSLQKIHTNLANSNNHFKANMQMWRNEKKNENSVTRAPRRRLIGKKSKNSKMSNQTTVVMMDWLLRNFQNPYPTTQDKVDMAKNSRISVTQVNNWFINARERTIKSYFVKNLE